MRIVGLGVDLAEIDRVRRLLARHPQRFLARCFTVHEQEYAGRYADPSARLAARFAGKEAVMKSLGTGWRRIRWTDVEITGGGMPRVNLTGTAARRAAAMGVTDVMVTITHTDDRALVMAVAVTADEGEWIDPGERRLRDLLDRVAEGWTRGSPGLAASAFGPDAVFDDGDRSVGRAAIAEHFASIPVGTDVTWVTIGFDDATDAGTGHYTLTDGDGVVRHAMAAVHLEDGLIGSWESYRPIE